MSKVKEKFLLVISFLEGNYSFSMNYPNFLYKSKNKCR